MRVRNGQSGGRGGNPIENTEKQGGGNEINAQKNKAMKERAREQDRGRERGKQTNTAFITSPPLTVFSGDFTMSRPIRCLGPALPQAPPSLHDLLPAGAQLDPSLIISLNISTSGVPSVTWGQETSQMMRASLKRDLSLNPPVDGF